MTRYRIAKTKEEKLAALKLLYQAYLRVGLVQESSSGLRVTPYHLNPQARIFIATNDSNEVIYTMSFIPDSPLGLPLEQIYRREVETFRLMGRKISEIGCLAGKQLDLASFMDLCAFVFLFGLNSGVDHYLIAVHPKHARFYERFWGFRQFAPMREYPYVQNFPAVALELDFSKADLRLPERTKAIISKVASQDLDFSPDGDCGIEFLREYVQDDFKALPNLTQES